MRDMKTRVDLDLARSHVIDGLSGLSEVGIDDNGVASVSIQDALDNRCRHLGLLSLCGKWTPRAEWRGETLRSLSVAPDGSRAVGCTGETLYFLGESGKQRFFLDRRGTWASVRIAAQASRFAAAVQDLFGDMGAVVLATLDGEPVWVQETLFVPVAVAVDPHATSVSAGGSDGSVVLWDDRRQLLWHHRTDDTIVDIACVGGHGCLVLLAGSGQRGPGVLAVGAEGEAVGFTPLPRTGQCLVASASGDRFFVLCRPADKPATILCAKSNGAVDLELELPGHSPDRDMALALSPSADFLAVHGAETALVVYRFRERPPSRANRVDDILLEAARRFGDGPTKDAMLWLARCWREFSGDRRIDHEFRVRRNEWRARLIATSATFSACGNWEAAVGTFSDWDDAFGDDLDLRQLRAECRVRWLATFEADATKAEAEGRLPDATQLYQRILGLDPDHRSAFLALERCEQTMVADSIEAARGRLQQSDFPGCRDFLVQADRWGASDCQTDPLWVQCRTGEALAQADQLYAARDYGAAAIQYRKVLDLHPGHPAATRGLEYAEAFRGDTHIDERFRRLE